MNIAIDLMGGDFAPENVILGIKDFLEQKQFYGKVTAIGTESAIYHARQELKEYESIMHWVAAPDVIEMHEHPTKALKSKPHSSINEGFTLLATSHTDAFISAGNTGAMMVGALYSIKSIPGVTRPAIGAYIPQEDGTLSLLIDVGLNADCKPENLVQFAILGSLYSQHILNIDNPRVALLNIGEEEGKGNILCQTAYPLLKGCNRILFTGNAEGRDLLKNKADVYVCEGFTGNVMLKFAESFYDIFKSHQIKDEYLNRFNFEMYGGVPVLGVNKPVIIGHGISGATAFNNMLQIAERMIQNNFIQTVTDAFV
ncbi:MAG TPA: phosphate acyltransferase PlsX [Ginsengibacter sp.]|nr:phosphate acyltransferase PlsX [Ginsengibacter sp.]HRP17981.1 phosphate acyltransferase PlsX [Ginsengibacter sp.]HRP43389.1 phosphate acyltransferase PlsX [Ginsengibacter sp.]